MLVASATIGALLAGTGATARADYGTRALYQVEISANNVQGGNFWFWAELDANGGDYQNTDCIHTTAGGNPPSSGGQVGAGHSSGSLDAPPTGWSDSGGQIVMHDVSIIGGLATADFTISDARHSNWLQIVVTWEALPFLPLGVPLTWSGTGTQVQVAAAP
ncbi:MAG TPA: hypothetical protein VE088_00885 [Gaiellaceae bacterium]|nr:hypothetical protein [Gaiellaceae bacterium]